MKAFRWLDNITKKQPFLCALLVLLIVIVPGYFLLENAQHQACKEVNEFKKSYVAQWEPILAETPTPKPPPDGSPKEVVDAYEAQVKTRKRFENSLDVGFAQKDC